MFVKYFLCLLLLIPVVSQAQVYRWVDADGKVHFSDRKPGQQVQSQNIELSEGNNYSGSEIYQRQQDAFKIYDGERTVKSEDAQKKRKAKKDLEKQCEYARYKLKLSQNARYLFDTRNNGERTVFTDEQRNAYTQRWQRIVSEKC